MNGVSLILCCHNSSDKLLSTLKYIECLESNLNIPYELIIIDNASTDNTSQVANQLIAPKLKRLSSIVCENKLGLRNARIKGIEVAQYEYISFIDDDNWICPDWVNLVYEIMSTKSDVGACGGIGFPSFESSAPDWFDQYKECYAVGAQGVSSGYVDDARGFLWGAGLTLRKTAWEELIRHGFIFTLSGRSGSNLSSGEDSEICFALRCHGWKLWYDERLYYYHYLPQYRLSTDYLKKLHRGFGASFVVLDTYRKYMDLNTNITHNFKYLWITDSIILMYDLLKCLAKIRDIIASEQKLRLILDVNLKIGKLFAILRLKTKYDKINRDIYVYVKKAKIGS